MSFPDLQVTEIFHSIQGETSLVGVPFSFIRLTGCNLRCTYCDTSYAFKGGRRMRISEVIEAVRPHGTRHALITGGEPLLQRQTPALVHALRDAGYTVSIETHGEHPIDSVAGQARLILDIKTPASGMSRGGFRRNLPLLHAGDEVKFVIASPEDYTWARDVVQSGKIPAVAEILFSPVQPAQNTPGTYAGVEPCWLAERILEDRLPVRFQLQLHKQLWGARSGV